MSLYKSVKFTPFCESFLVKSIIIHKKCFIIIKTETVRKEKKKADANFNKISLLIQFFHKLFSLFEIFHTVVSLLLVQQPDIRQLALIRSHHVLSTLTIPRSGHRHRISNTLLEASESNPVDIAPFANKRLYSQANGLLAQIDAYDRRLQN